jgi:hypothetical protein
MMLQHVLSNKHALAVVARVAVAKVAFLAVHITSLEYVYAYDVQYWARYGTGSHAFLYKYAALTCVFAAVAAYPVGVLFGRATPLTQLFLTLLMVETLVTTGIAVLAGLTMKRFVGDGEGHAYAYGAKIIREFVTRVVFVFTIFPTSLVVLSLTRNVLWV